MQNSHCILGLVSAIVTFPMFVRRRQERLLKNRIDEKFETKVDLVKIQNTNTRH